jgi:hypothetical protein
LYDLLAAKMPAAAPPVAAEAVPVLVALLELLALPEPLELEL